MNPIISRLAWLNLSVLIIAADQITKHWASAHLEYASPWPVMSFFNFTLLHNTGAAFSFLADAGGWQHWFFTLLALIVSIVLIIWLLRVPAQRIALPAGLALILGGALGNVWDRLTLGYVVDFLDFYINNWHWPAFNIADSAIFVGAVLLIFDALKNNHTDK